MANDPETRIILRFDDKATRGFKRSFDKISRQNKQITSTFKQSALSIRKSWLAITAAIVGAGFAIRGTIGQAIAFESAFAGVRKTVDATEEEFRQLNAAILDMSKTIPVSAIELAEIQEIAGQLGIRGVKNLTKFTETIARIAVSTNLTREQAATDFARIASVMGEPIENIDRMGSAVVDLGNKFPVTEQEILSFTSRITGMGRIAGLTTDEVLGIGAAFASVGIQAQAGGTAINKILLDLQKQGKTGIGAFTGFIKDLETSGDKAGQVLDELGIKESRAQRAFLTLAQAGGRLETALRISADAAREANAVMLESEKRFATTASQIEIFKNNLNALGIEIGNTFTPSLNVALPSLTKFVNLLSEGGKFISQMAERIGFLSAGGNLKDFVVDLDPITAEPPKVVADEKPTQKFAENTNKSFEAIQKLGKDTNRVLQGSLGDLTKVSAIAFGQMTVGAKDFQETMISGIKQVAATFIAQVTLMIAKLLILKTIELSFGGGSGAFSFFSSIFAGARGGIVPRDGPVLVGERGPEIVDLPRGARVLPSGQNINSTTSNVMIENANFGSPEDAEESIEDISTMLNERLRAK